VSTPETPDTTRTATLLVLSPEPETAAALTSRLRGQRIALVVEHLASFEDLDTHPIQEEDIVVWDARGSWPVRELTSRLAARNLDPPLLALLATLEPARLAAFAEEGVCDLVALDQPEHLGAVVRRELRVAESRRERRRLNEACHELRANWETTLQALPLPVALLQDGTHVFANDVYRRFFHKDDLTDTPFLGLFPKSEHETLKKALRAAARAGMGQAALELTVPHPDDARGVVPLYLWPETHEGTPAVLALLHPAAASLPAPQAEGTASSEPSPPASPKRETSGLETPARFVARVEEYLRSSAPKKTDQALLMVGVDDYTRVVEEYGPLVGESVLKQVEQRLLRELHPLEFATRLGRDHYAWLQRPRGEGIELFAQSLVNHLNEHVYESGGHSLHVAVRVGWSDRRDHRDVWGLVRAAHNAFARSGGQAVSRYIAGVPGIENPEEIAGLFRRLLEDGRLALSRSPLSALRTSVSDKIQLLDSAPEAPLDQIPRRDLFTILKRAELLRVHDRWLISQALLRRSSLTGRNERAVLALRLSGETIDDEDFLPWLGKEMARVGKGHLLILVSERTAAGRLRTLPAFAQSAAQHGIKIGLCDFGTGSQSPALLRYVRPALVILRRELSAELASLAALEASARAAASPLGALLEACRAASIPTALIASSLKAEELQAVHKLYLSYVLNETPEILAPAG